MSHSKINRWHTYAYAASADGAAEMNRHCKKSLYVLNNIHKKVVENL